MSTFAKKVTSAVAGLAVVFSIVTPIAGVSAAFSGLEAAQELSTLDIIENQAVAADYRLGDTTSREELSKVISKLADLSADSSDSIYQDTDFASWSEKYAKALNEAGIAASNTLFNPKDNSSKIEALKWVMEARDIESGVGANWMEERVNGAVAAGIATSFSDYNADVTRGQVFIWAAEAIATEVVVEPTDPLCELLGIGCEGEVVVEPVEPVEPTEPTTPTEGGTASISKSPESPSNGLAAVNTPRVSMLAFDVTAGSSDVTLEQITLYHVGLGDRTNVDDVTVYNSMNESVSKTKSFSDNDLDISFDRDVVVQAGETQTFTVAATLTDSSATPGSINTTYQVELTALEASASVSGAGIVGAALTPTSVSNSGELSVSDDTASDDITIGEEVTLAGFSIEEKNDNEDVLIRTITLHQNGSIDADYIEDLTLEADGEVIASDIMVNSDDELVMNIDYVLAADDEVDFELMGTISGDVTETVHFEFEGSDDIYATGVSTGFNIGFTSGNEPQTANVADSETVEGAEIDAVFDKSDVDETKVDVDDVLVGTLELTANSNDYEVTKITVTVSGTAGTAAIDDLYLDGQSYDDLTGSVYTFEDIVLTQGVTEVLPLEFDVKDNVGLNGQDVSFAIKITEIEDDENDVDYNVGGTSGNSDISDILSTNAFDNQSIDIETASFQLTQTKVNDRELVLANGTETVLYKAKVSVGDSDDVTIEDFDLTLDAGNSTYTAADSLKDIIDSATLNIGGTTYDADIKAGSVDFNIDHVIAAGSDNVEVLVTAVLQDDNLTSTKTITLTLDTAGADGVSYAGTTATDPNRADDGIKLEDSDNESVSVANVSTGTKDTKTTLREEGTFMVKVINEVDTDDNLENTVLAGNDAVVLAELEIEAEYEDMDVNTLEFTIPGDFSDTLNNVSLVNGSAVIADGAIVTLVGGNTVIKFEDFTVADADDLIEAELVADLSTYTGEGDETSAQLGAVVVSVDAATLDVDGADSNNDITDDVAGAASANQIAATTSTVAGESVTVVPTLLVFSVVESLSNGQAKVKITADSGNNTVGTSNETPEVKLNTLTFTDLASSDGGYIVYKDGEAATQGSLAAGTGAKPVTFGSVDVTFDNSQTYVIVPAAVADKTYSLVLSGLVANYDVQDSSGTAVTGGSALTTTLESDVSVGSKTY